MEYLRQTAHRLSANGTTGLKSISAACESGWVTHAVLSYRRVWMQLAQRDHIHNNDRNAGRDYIGSQRESGRGGEEGKWVRWREME